MGLDELINVIRQAGGKRLAEEYAPELLKKVNRLEETRSFDTLFKQLRKSNEQGDFRGRVLEVNFANRLIETGAELQYEAKQGQSGDVDFCWLVNGYKVFIEMKLLGEDRATKKNVAQQLTSTGQYIVSIPDDTRDIFRIQREIIEKSSSTKFNPTQKPDWINLVAVDISELQLGSVDIGDCLLAVGGNDLLVGNCQKPLQRPNVEGVFETPKENQTAGKIDWAKQLDGISTDNSNPRGYLHGVLFLFRDPDSREALSYKLSGLIVWNQHLVRKSLAESLEDAFHKLVPRYLSLSRKKDVNRDLFHQIG